MSDRGGVAGRANDASTIRQYIGQEGLISRSPTAGELEVVAAGLDAMGIARASYDGKRQ